MTGRRGFFDQVRLPKSQETILIYDRDTRARVFDITLGRAMELVDFELSPDGSMLAVLLGDTVELFKIP